MPWYYSKGLLISFCADLLSFFVLSKDIQRKGKLWKFVLCTIAVCIPSYLLRVKFWAVLSDAFLSFMLLSLCYETNDGKNSFLLMIVYVTLMQVGKLLPAGVVMPSQIWSQPYNYINAPLRILLAFAFSRYSLLICQTKRRLPEYVLLLVCFLQIYALHSFASSSMAESRSFNAVVSVICLGTLGTLFSAFWYMESTMHRLEAEQLESAMQEQYRQFQIRQNMEQTIARMHHDLKHQLNVLSKLTEDQEIKRSVSSMVGSLKEYEILYDTGNKTVDVLLSEKSREASENGVSIEVFADCAACGFMSHVDICSLFGNALSNAIEAAALLPQPEKRQVMVKAASINGFFILKVQNYYTGELRRRGDMLLTTKENTRLHGFGMPSIQYVVSQYQGSVQTSTEENRFVLQVVLPIPQENMENGTQH